VPGLLLLLLLLQPKHGHKKHSYKHEKEQYNKGGDNEDGNDEDAKAVGAPGKETMLQHAGV